VSLLAAVAGMLLSAGVHHREADGGEADAIPRNLREELAAAMPERVSQDVDPCFYPFREILGVERIDVGASGEEAERETPHGSFSGFFDLHGSSRAWKETVWDQYLTEPPILLPLALGIASVAVLPWDRRLERHWQGVIHGKQNLGNIGVYSLIGISALTGALFPGEGRNAWDESWTVAESFLCSYLTTTVLKSTVHRLRPGHGTHSFPSGHSAMAFSAATLIENNLGPYAGIPAYGLAAFTGFERVESGRHYPSDVFAGAAIGTLSAGIIDTLHWGGPPGKGGIADRTFACSVEAQGLHGFQMQVAIQF
jgi:membrane-associated phospholipid phosphatase